MFSCLPHLFSRVSSFEGPHWRGFDIFIRSSGWLQLSVCGCFNTKNADITKFLLNSSENDNPVTLMLVTSETFSIPCEQRPFKRKITSGPFYFRYGTQIVITFLCNIFRSYIMREFKNIVRIEAGGKNERKERESFLPLIFASLRETSAGREAYRLWSITKSSVPKYFLETTIHFCHKRINWWIKPNLFYNCQRNWNF